MSKKCFFCLPAALIMLMTGCSDRTELGDRAIIQAAAIDFAGGEYYVSTLLFSSGGGGGDTIDASQENVIKVSGSGKTLTEAVDNISLTDGKEIYLSETKLLILGSGFEEADAGEALNTLYRDMRLSLNMPVCCAENAEMLTDLHFTEGITSAEKPLDLIENAYKAGVSPKALLLDVLADTAAGRETLIPMFAETENGYGMTTDENGKTAVLCGSRKLSGGKLTDYADEEETKGLMLLSGQSDRLLLNYVADNRERTCEAFGIKVKILRGGAVNLKANFRERSGAMLSDEESKEAMKELSRLIKLAL